MLLYCNKYLFRVITVILQQGHTSLHIRANKKLPPFLKRHSVWLIKQTSNQNSQNTCTQLTSTASGRNPESSFTPGNQNTQLYYDKVRLMHKYSDWLDDSKLINGETKPNLLVTDDAGDVYYGMFCIMSSDWWITQTAYYSNFLWAL